MCLVGRDLSSSSESRFTRLAAVKIVGASQGGGGGLMRFPPHRSVLLRSLSSAGLVVCFVPVARFSELSRLPYPVPVHRSRFYASPVGTLFPF